MNEDNRRLFKGTLENDHESWHGYLRSLGAFFPLIKHIFEINHLMFDESSFAKMPSGAVYHTGNKVVKIYFPPEIKTRVCDTRGYTTELVAMEHARRVGILAPEIICNGSVYDEPYTFDYIVMNYIEGSLVKELIPDYSDSEKAEFAIKLKDVMNMLHIPAPDLNIPRFDDFGMINNTLWNNLPESFREDRQRHISNTVYPELVVCQGDMGGQNIIIDSKGRLNIIDFAESIHAPCYYDERTLLEDYWQDRILMEALYGDYKNDKFYDMITMSMLLGWFNGVIIGWLAEKIGYDFNRITSVKALKVMLIELLNGGK